MPKSHAKSPENLLAIFSEDADRTGELPPPSQESLEELSDGDMIEEAVAVAPAPEPAPVSKPSRVEASMAKVVAPKIIEAAPESADSGEPTIVIDRKEMAAAAAEKRSEPAADRTMRMARSDVFKAAAIVAKADAVVPPAPITARVLPSSPPPPRAQHASIAPVAMDVQTRSFAPAYAQPQKASPIAAIAIGAAALFLVAGAAIGGVVYGTRSSSSTASASADRDEPRRSSVESAKDTSDDDKPASAKEPSTDPSEMPTSDIASLPSAPKPAARPAQPRVASNDKPASDKPASDKPALPRGAAAPAAPPPAAPPAQTAAAPAAPAPQPAGPAATTGTIRVPVSDSIVTIKVDGSYRRVKNGNVVVPCGRHNVQVGMSAKSVDVPCGGSVNVE